MTFIKILFLTLLFQTQIMAQTKATLIYVGDPMCSWCYGFAEELSTAVDGLSDQTDLQIIMGGLRPYNTETMADLKDFLREHWEQVKVRSGQPFNYDILDDASFVYDTEPPSRAVLVVRKLKPEKELYFFKAVQKLFYYENKNTNEVVAYLELAQEIGIDAETFKKEFSSEAMKEAVKADFAAAGQLGVRSFPTLVLKKGEQYYLVSSGYDQAERIVTKVKEMLKN